MNLFLPAFYNQDLVSASLLPLSQGQVVWATLGLLGCYPMAPMEAGELLSVSGFPSWSNPGTSSVPFRHCFQHRGRTPPYRLSGLPSCRSKPRATADPEHRSQVPCAAASNPCYLSAGCAAGSAGQQEPPAAPESRVALGCSDGRAQRYLKPCRSPRCAPSYRTGSTLQEGQARRYGIGEAVLVLCSSMYAWMEGRCALP